MQTRDREEDPADGLAGRLIDGRYRLIRPIGRGGASEVYLAHDETLPRDVAIKLMTPGAADAENLERQRSEVDTLAALNHHGLVTLIDAGAESTPHGERAFLVMEYVDGPTLHELCGRGPCDPDAVGHVGADVAEALHYVHGKGLVHRDIKPGNILLTKYGMPGREFTAKLADFGIARLIDGTRLTATGTIIGTASYLSPEQARGGEVGPASDVYSLGLVLLEALTGERAFPGHAAEAIAARLHHAPTVPAELDQGWRSLLISMTTPEPAARPAALDVALRLRTLATRDDHAPTPSSVDGDRRDEQPLTVSFSPVDDEETATRRLTMATTTESVSGGPTQTATPATGTATVSGAELRRPRSPEPTRRTGRTIAVVAAALVVAGLAAGGVAWAVANQQTESSPSVSYPAVPGTLGDHLEQLQESVER